MLKVFHGKVQMTFDDPAAAQARPTMTHSFYMDENGTGQGEALDRLGRAVRVLAARPQALLNRPSLRLRISAKLGYNIPVLAGGAVG